MNLKKNGRKAIEAYHWLFHVFFYCFSAMYVFVLAYKIDQFLKAQIPSDISSIRLGVVYLSLAILAISRLLLILLGAMSASVLIDKIKKIKL